MPIKLCLRLSIYTAITITITSATVLARIPTGSEMCDRAAEQAAKTSGVPIEILFAITRVETGRQQSNGVQPWPWAVNHGGEGFWFEDANQAITYANEQLALGEENFDVGCFQINMHWHGENFATLEEAFDPQSNAAYAAHFLSELYKTEGGWAEAVAAYHSRSPAEAETYLAKVESAAAALQNEGSTPVDQLAMIEPEQPRVNRFPLLQTGGRGSGASLVPITDGGTPLFGAAP